MPLWAHPFLVLLLQRPVGSPLTPVGVGLLLLHHLARSFPLAGTANGRQQTHLLGVCRPLGGGRAEGLGSHRRERGYQHPLPLPLQLLLLLLWPQPLKPELSHYQTHGLFPASVLPLLFRGRISRQLGVQPSLQLS